jgi:hypothetical protein
MIRKYELKAKNKITALGALPVPVLRYSYGKATWRLEEPRKLTGKLERC